MNCSFISLSPSLYSHSLPWLSGDPSIPLHFPFLLLLACSIRVTILSNYAEVWISHIAPWIALSLCCTFLFHYHSVFGQICVLHSLASWELLAVFHFLLSYITVHQEHVSYFNFEIIQLLIFTLHLLVKGQLPLGWPTCSWCCLHYSCTFGGALCLSYHHYWCFGSLNHCLCYGLC